MQRCSTRLPFVTGANKRARVVAAYLQEPDMNALGAGEVARKGNAREIVVAVLGVIGAIVASLFTAPLDGSVDTPAARIIQLLPRLAHWVAAGVATVFAVRLLTFLGRKVRPWFRSPGAKLRDLVYEIEELYGYDKNRMLASQQNRTLLAARFVGRSEVLIDKLRKLDIPTPEPTNYLLWRDFLRLLYRAAVGGNVKIARKAFERIEAADEKTAAADNKADSGTAAADRLLRTLETRLAIEVKARRTAEIRMAELEARLRAHGVEE